MGMQGVTVRSASDQEGNRSDHAIRQRIRGEIRSAWHDLWDHRIEDKRTAEDLAIAVIVLVAPEPR